MWGSSQQMDVDTLTHWGRDEIDAIWQTTFSNVFSWMKNVPIVIKNSMRFVPKGPINNIPALVQIMAWRRPGDKPLSELMVGKLLTHICVTRPQWVNSLLWSRFLRVWSEICTPVPRCKSLWRERAVLRLNRPADKTRYLSCWCAVAFCALVQLS